MAAPDLSDRTIHECLDLRGRRALVTGGAQGVGLAVGRRLVEASATVAIVDLDAARAEAAAQEITAAGGTAIGLAADISDRAGVGAAVAATVDRLGGLDIVVNNAALFPAAPVLDQPDELWDRVIDVNLSGAYIVSRAAGPHLMASGHGVIVNVCSTESFRAGGPALSAYVSSKHALRGLTAAMAVEWGPAAVRVVGVAPTVVDTPGLAELKAQVPPLAATIDQLARSLPLGRVAVADDVARVVLFAVSDLAGLVTGCVLPVDAGALAQ